MEDHRREEREKMDERRKEDKKERDDRRAELIRSLKEDGIIAKDVDDVSFHINDEEMIVNGVKQPESVFNKYREKMKKAPTKPGSPKPSPVNSMFKQSGTSLFKGPVSPLFKITPVILFSPDSKQLFAKPKPVAQTI
jgi:deoxyribodipyrimidine photolyase